MNGKTKTKTIPSTKVHTHIHAHKKTVLERFSSGKFDMFLPYAGKRAIKNVYENIECVKIPVVTMSLHSVRGMAMNLIVIIA